MHTTTYVRQGSIKSCEIQSSASMKTVERSLQLQISKQNMILKKKKKVLCYGWAVYIHSNCAYKWVLWFCNTSTAHFKLDIYFKRRLLKSSLFCAFSPSFCNLYICVHTRRKKKKPVTLTYLWKPCATSNTKHKENLACRMGYNQALLPSPTHYPLLPALPIHPQFIHSCLRHFCVSFQTDLCEPHSQAVNMALTQL